MKKLFTLFLLFISLLINAQDSKTKATYSKDEISKITSLSYSSTSIKDLEKLNWNDIKTIFEGNKPDEKIALSFELDLKESKNKFKGKMEVSGETKNIDSLIFKSKKIIKKLIKIAKNQ
ncbi:hypothetical protein [Polaribacter sp.]|uniref:hypothetical protein n=1 Tax=Polaribacter sp. TaxID=1920175 RepID=UPI003F6AFD9D